MASRQNPESRKRAAAPDRHSSTSRNSGNYNRASRSGQQSAAPTQDDISRYSRKSYGTHPDGWDAPSAPAQSGAYRPAYNGQDYRGSHAAAAQYSRNGGQYRAVSKKRHRGKKIALGIVCAVVVVLLGVGIAVASYIGGVNKELQGNKTSSELQAIDKELTRTTTFTEPFYVMLIGSDAREDDEEMGQRSDTNIVARVDPTTNTVTLVSIPRDTMITLSGVGTQKFNAAYNYDGAAGVIREAKSLTGIAISHYAEIDFNGLIQLVDAVGGVDVEVDERIDDEDAGDIVIEEGLQHLNGEAALVFARSRAYVDGDYTRVANQRKLIQAIVDKVMNMSATDVPSVVSAAAKCVTTDLNVTDIVSLALQLRDGDGITIYSATIPSSTQYVDGISYVVADKQGTKELMKVVDEGGDPTTVTNGYLGSTDSGSSGTTGTYDTSNSYNGGYSNSAGTAGGNGYATNNGYANNNGYGATQQGYYGN